MFTFYLSSEMYMVRRAAHYKKKSIPPQPILILRDSILSFLGVSEEEILFSPGSRLCHWLRIITKLKHLKLAARKMILIHVGTNDIPKMPPWEIVQCYKMLVNQILTINPYVIILLSAILPQPRDIRKTQPLVRATNDLVQLECRKRGGGGEWSS